VLALVLRLKQFNKESRIISTMAPSVMPVSERGKK